MAIEFVPAVRKQAKLKLAITGPAGSGKTFTALRIAHGLDRTHKPAVIDTEAGSASLYAGEFAFDVLTLRDHSPAGFIAAIRAAVKAGYPVVIVDSLSHEWMAVLNAVDEAKARQRNQFTAWKDPSEAHRSLIETMLHADAHIIVTMRSKMEYAQRTNEKGDKEIVKLGMAPVQREGSEYEFSLVIDMDVQHRGIVSKTRYLPFADRVILKPGEELGEELAAWLAEGAPATVESQQTEMEIPSMTRPHAETLLGLAVDEAELDAARKVANAVQTTAAQIRLKEWKYDTWKAFYERGTPEQAAEVLKVLKA